MCCCPAHTHKVIQKNKLNWPKSKGRALCNEVSLGATGIWDTVCVIRASLSCCLVKVILNINLFYIYFNFLFQNSFFVINNLNFNEKNC